MRKLLRWTVGIVTVLVLVGLVVYLAVDEDRPVGEPGPRAEALADKMLAAVNAAAWDTTAYVAWDFGGRQQHRWWRDVDTVEVTWGDKRVTLHTETVTGRAYDDGLRQNGPAADALVREAWAHFCNDGFWVAAPFKIRDPGTERRYVELPDGRDGLLVTYASGGVTPGDAYLWHLDDAGLPVAYRMWVSIIPIGGLEATWTHYVTLPSGARVATRHEIAGVVPLNVDVTAAGGED